MYVLTYDCLPSSICIHLYLDYAYSNWALPLGVGSCGIERCNGTFPIERHFFWQLPSFPIFINQAFFVHCASRCLRKLHLVFTYSHTPAFQGCRKHLVRILASKETKPESSEAHFHQRAMTDLGHARAVRGFSKLRNLPESVRGRGRNTKGVERLAPKLLQLPQLIHP